LSIQTKSISYAVNEKKILNDISVEINPGEVTTIIGPNGSGKSTLLKIISGDFENITDKVFYDETVLSSISLKRRAQIRSVMSQSQMIMFDYYVRDILSMGWLGFENAENLDVYEKLLEKIVDDCAIASLMDRKFNVLSGGEQRRVHFARTLLQLNYEEKQSINKYLLLDEPTANLDLRWEVRLMENIKKIAKTGIGVFLVLHNLDLALNFSDKIALLNKGMLHSFGSVKDVFRDDVLSDVYEIDIKVDTNNGRINYY
tara:strand:- start:332 stop:1105 length:774 start_codon:yes stop_codon:yes gene_type:complete